jgi:hypothetical protein
VGYVYFIQIGSCGDIKIGFSTNILNRFNTIKTSIPDQIKLLGYMSGSMKLEKELHKKFRVLWKKGEWFHCDRVLIDFINEHNEMCIGNMGVYIELDENKNTQIYSKMSR